MKAKRPTAELHVINAEPVDGSIVTKLERVLELAKSEQLSSCAIAFVWRDGCVGSHWTDAPNMSLLVGAVERMKHRIITTAEEQ